MESHLSVAKIIGSSSDSSWAQVYSAGKLNIVLSFAGEKESLATLGKESLEKLQREFFALDDKSLENITKAVKTVSDSFPEDLSASLIVTTVVDGVLYIVIWNAGSVVLKRKGVISIIGAGKKGNISTFSGKILPNDSLITLTEGAVATLSFEKISEALSQNTPGEIAEHLAPLVHSNSSGTEAALIWKVLSPHKGSDEESENSDEEAVLESEAPETKGMFSFLPSLPFPGLKSLARFNFSSLAKLDRKKIVIIVIVVLLVFLVAGFYIQKFRQNESKQQALLNKILSSDQQKYDDALAVMELNRGMGTQELSQIKDDVEKNLSNFPTGSSQKKTLQDFLDKINTSLGGSSQGPSKINTFFDASKNSDLTSVLYISLKGGNIIAVGKNKGGILNSDGSVSKTFDVSGTRAITSDEKNIYILSGDSVLQATKTGGSPSSIIDKQASPISIDTFGGNIYLLSGADKTIYKYRPNDFNKESYFTSDIKLSNPSSITIDSSIYIIDDGGIKKFTRGAQDTLSYKGKTLSPNSQIYTDQDYVNLYVVDPASKTAIILDKTGAIVSEIPLKGMNSITSVAADEKNKKMYVVADNKIYEIAF